MNKLRLLITIIFFFFLGSISTACHAIAVDEENPSTDPLGLVLTWQQDPASTMTIDWHTPDNGSMREIEYKKVTADEWESITGDQIQFPFSERVINRVELTDLEADTEYHFRFGENTRIRKFRTMPLDASRPIRFAAGGDVRHRIEWMDQTNRRAARYNPDFVIWGGDMAYADGREDRLYRWYEFMNSIMNTLITDDGRSIPVLAGIGNHEVRGGYYHNDDHNLREEMPPYSQTDESREQIAPYYFTLFAFPGQPGYGVLDFGDYMSILLLDTDHANPIEGEQTEWLEEVLAEREHVPHIFPNYHVPAYPSVRNPGDTTHRRVLDRWVPLFERYGVMVAFENHDHIYKRTYPIRNGEINNNGVVYMGDGAWGVGTREIGANHDEHAWYLKRASSERHFIIGTIQGKHQHFLVVNEDGEIIDEYPETPNLEIRNMALPWAEELD